MFLSISCCAALFSTRTFFTFKYNIVDIAVLLKILRKVLCYKLKMTFFPTQSP